MSEPKFHTIDPEAIKKISIEQIQSQHHQVLETADYTIAVPTTNQTIPHYNDIQRNGSRPIFIPKLDAPYRGRIGGC
jgi:hypothetical protein